VISAVGLLPGPPIRVVPTVPVEASATGREGEP